MPIPLTRALAHAAVFLLLVLLVVGDTAGAAEMDRSDLPGAAAMPRAHPSGPYANMPAGLYTVERQGTGVFYHKGMVLDVGVHVIDADLSDPEVKIGVMVAEGGIGKAESFHTMVQRAKPAAAITGTFFGIRNRLPTGDLVVNGNSLFRGFIGTAVAITEGNIVSFIETQYGDQEIDWSMFDTVIRGGPWLVKQGELFVAPRSEGFRTLPVSQRRRRTAVALTADNHLLFIAVRENISLWELAKISKALGVYHAVALDGGTSTALYFAGRHIANPGRGLTNLLLIYHRRDSYEAARPQFAGARALPKERARTELPDLAGLGVAAPTGFAPAQMLDFPAPDAGGG